ncbi:hypothetical protein PSTG_18981, partial [Puccinia striiformis f. sp. tritici PST-78]
MDLDNLTIMNAFTHWTYITSQGTSLVCDLQGVGPILTDPQILDRDTVRWADGNNSSKGIDIFVATHQCNPICGALELELPGNVIVNMPALTTCLLLT